MMNAVKRRHFIAAGIAGLASQSFAKTRDIHKAIMYATIQVPGTIMEKFKADSLADLIRLWMLAKDAIES